MNRWLGQLGFYASRLARTVQSIRRGNASAYYEGLGDDVLEDRGEHFADPTKPLWLNLGYWANAHTYPQAAAALAQLLGERVGLSRGDTVFDAGFGYAEQDLFWVQHFDVARIEGTNITPLHVQVARQRVARAGLSHRIRLSVGSAVAVPQPDAHFSHVVALESAFHFDTRQRFFHEAARLLPPGGRLGLADMVPMPGARTDRLLQRLGRRYSSIPAANMVDRHVYAQQLRAAGFGQVEVESIRGYTFPGLAKYNVYRPPGRAMSDVVIALSPDEITTCAGVEFWERHTGLSDYIIATATRL